MEDFEAEKIKKMSKDEIFEFLGEENASWLRENLKNGNLSIEELANFCRKNFPNPLQADFVQKVIMNLLSKSEFFNLYTRNPKKQQQYAEINELREKMQKGKITVEDLNRLCELAFPDEPELANEVKRRFIESGRIKEDNSKETGNSSKDEYDK